MERDIWKAVSYFRKIRKIMLSEVSDDYENGKVYIDTEDEE